MISRYYVLESHKATKLIKLSSNPKNVSYVCHLLEGLVGIATLSAAKLALHDPTVRINSEYTQTKLEQIWPHGPQTHRSRVTARWSWYSLGARAAAARPPPRPPPPPSGPPPTRWPAPTPWSICDRSLPSPMRMLVSAAILFGYELCSTSPLAPPNVK